LFTTNANSGFLGCCIPYGYTCPPGSDDNGPCYTLTDGPHSIQGSCEKITEDNPLGAVQNGDAWTGINNGILPKMALPGGGNTTPFITPDTPIIQESKLLRNLFKKEFMNASKPNTEAKLREAIKRMLKNKK
jgi:hypothetical protein